MINNKNKPLNNNFIHFFQKMNKISRNQEAVLKEAGGEVNNRDEFKPGDRGGRQDASKVGLVLNNQQPKKMQEERASKFLHQQAPTANREALQKPAALNKRQSGQNGQTDSKFGTHPAIPEFLDVASNPI